jgi:hypothetical protein
MEDSTAALLDGWFRMTPSVGSGSRTISFNLLRPGRVLLRAFDHAGRTTAMLCDNWLGPGAHSFGFAPPVAGVYFIELTVPGLVTQTRKAVVLR